MRRAPRHAATVAISALVAATLVATALGVPRLLTAAAQPLPIKVRPLAPSIQIPPETAREDQGMSKTSNPDDGSGTFTPGAFDVESTIKYTAAHFVETAGTRRSSDPPDVGARLIGAGYSADLAAMAGPLLDTPTTESTTTVIYPQYGGLTATSASVMVLARQKLAGGDRVREVLLDVRMLRATDGTWRVTSTVDPPRPRIAPRRPGGPTSVGRNILDDPQIRLPGPARADVTERRVDDPILTVLARLADRYRLDVQVMVSGHPGTVFPTSRVSNHTVGRAVDVRAIDGRRVSDIPRDDPMLAEFMIAAGRAGATEVGGPIDPDGTGFFSDAVHQDHFHLGITPTKPPAARAGGPR